MTKEQMANIKTILESKVDPQDPTSDYIVKGFRFEDGHSSIFTSYDGFLYLNMDENKEWLVCLRSNNNHYTQTRAQIAVSLIDFGDIANVEMFIPKKYAETFLSTVMPGITAERKADIMKWISYIENSNLSPDIERPYYDNKSPSIGDHNHAPNVAPYVDNTDVGERGYFDN